MCEHSYVVGYGTAGCCWRNGGFGDEVVLLGGIEKIAALHRHRLGSVAGSGAPTPEAGQHDGQQGFATSLGISRRASVYVLTVFTGIGH